jgi:hypothetical protein
VLLFVQAIIMASNKLQMSKEGTAGKREHGLLTIPNTLEIIRRL